MEDWKKGLEQVVGPQNVNQDPQALKSYCRDFSLLESAAPPQLIVCPQNAEQVEGIVKYANENMVPLIPVSSEMHFHGSTLPKMGGVIVNLRQMNRILDIDLPDRLARIEPGVTWARLQGELAKIGHRMIMPLRPPATSSVITSLLEREVPTNPRWEYGEPMTSTEVVWGNGMRFRTGSASVPGFPERADSKGGNPEGPGTNWYRFFQGAEGTMGILTWAIVKFEFLPRLNKTCFLCFENLEEAIEPLYQIQRQMIGNECFLINREIGALLFADNWPHDYLQVKEALPPYLIILVLSGGPRMPEGKLAYEMRALEQTAGRLPAVERLDFQLPGLAGLEERLPELLRTPWPEGQAFWKHRHKGACQALFFITKMERAPQFAREVVQRAGARGYDVNSLGLYLQPIEQGRACHLEFQYYYDPESASEKAFIKELYLETARELFRQGAFFSRPYGLLAPMVFEAARGYTNTISKIKEVLDPNAILCPGNACF